MLYHSVMWQYLPADTRADITALMEEAGRAATPETPAAPGCGWKPTAQTFAHELTVKYWPQGDERLG